MWMTVLIGDNCADEVWKQFKVQTSSPVKVVDEYTSKYTENLLFHSAVKQACIKAKDVSILVLQRKKVRHFLNPILGIWIY